MIQNHEFFQDYFKGNLAECIAIGHNYCVLSKRGFTAARKLYIDKLESLISDFTTGKGGKDDAEWRLANFIHELNPISDDLMPLPLDGCLLEITFNNSNHSIQSDGNMITLNDTLMSRIINNNEWGHEDKYSEIYNSDILAKVLNRAGGISDPTTLEVLSSDIPHSPSKPVVGTTFSRGYTFEEPYISPIKVEVAEILEDPTVEETLILEDIYEHPEAGSQTSEFSYIKAYPKVFAAVGIINYTCKVLKDLKYQKGANQAKDVTSTIGRLNYKEQKY